MATSDEEAVDELLESVVDDVPEVDVVAPVDVVLPVVLDVEVEVAPIDARASNTAAIMPPPPPGGGGGGLSVAEVLLVLLLVLWACCDRIVDKAERGMDKPLLLLLTELTLMIRS